MTLRDFEVGFRQGKLGAHRNLGIFILFGKGLNGSIRSLADRDGGYGCLHTIGIGVTGRHHISVGHRQALPRHIVIFGQTPRSLVVAQKITTSEDSAMGRRLTQINPPLCSGLGLQQHRDKIASIGQISAQITDLKMKGFPGISSSHSLLKILVENLKDRMGNHFGRSGHPFLVSFTILILNAKINLLSRLHDQSATELFKNASGTA